jgi:glycyl-tRNA synthetase
MLEVDTTVLTPHIVFKTSGHVDRFADWMCKDAKTGDIFRADHFVEDVLEARLKGDKEARGQAIAEEEAKDAKAAKRKKKAGSVAAQKLDDAVVKEYEEVLAQIDNFDGPGLGELIKKYDLRVPASGQLPTEPVAFNLMFSTTIGPSANSPGYLRPETAQGQFLNFAKLLDFNQGNMPFASASIGKSYRNEIAPRGGLLRVREFLMAEIEHYVDPEGGKKHARFHEIEDLELDLLDRDTQLSGSTKTKRMTVKKAVADRVIDNETLGYFLGRVNLFMKKIGIDSRKMRLRQHMANEMAHYATDCWDTELLTSSGWIECVGCADRSAYDLTVHSKATDKPLVVRETLDNPRTVEEYEVEIDKKKFGPLFKKDAKAVEVALTAATQECRERWAKELQDNGKISVEATGIAKPVEVSSDLVVVEKRKRTEHTRDYIPNVIEPSFGIGRILYALCEHVYWVREGGDEARSVSAVLCLTLTLYFGHSLPRVTNSSLNICHGQQVLSFPPSVAPIKAVITPLSSNKDFRPHTTTLSQKLRAAHVSTRVDDSSASIGKRYSRNDELGTLLGLTIDFQTLVDGTVTLRNRDTTRQVRADMGRVVEACRQIVVGEKSWEDIEGELPRFEEQEVKIAVR